MRLLSIGRPLQHRQADNHTIYNAPALFDYDLIAIDPAGVFEQVRQVVRAEEAHRTGNELAVVNGASTADALGVGELMQRRRDEVVRALERGALIVVFLYPTAAMPEVTGFSGADRYFFLPAPAGAAWDARTIRWGEGASGVVLDPGHPFAGALEAVRPAVRYRAYIDDQAPGIAGAIRPFARSAGGAVIGAEFPVLGGRVVFLPTLAERGGPTAGPLAAGILDAAAALLRRSGDEEEPRWAQERTLPGLPELEARETQAEQRAQEAQEAANAARADAAALRALREVMWMRGRHAVEPAAVRCLEALGFRRATTEEDGQRLRAPEGVLLLEADAREEPVGMAPHYRLRRRLDAQLEADGTAGRGLVVASGEVARDPERRERQYTAALATGAEATRYALITGSDLFEAARYALTEPGDEALSALRSALLTTDGVVSLDIPRE